MKRDTAMKKGEPAAGGSLLLVNYHYVRDPALYCYPGIHPLSPAGLGRQVERLASLLHVATPDEAEAFLLDGKALPGPSVLLTFDDGLVDHAWTARNILDPMGLKAFFFVCSRPLTEGRALAVHKVHYLRATTEPNQFRAELLAVLPDTWRSRRLTGMESEAAARTYIYDSREHAEIKYLLNFLLPDDVVDEATSAMLAARGINERTFCRETYMDEAALRALELDGHRIGAHTHDHRPVTRLGEAEERLMELNVSTIAAATGRSPAWISYPYGRDWALPADCADFCRRHGFSIGVTLMGEWVRPEHVPFALDRINTNEVDCLLNC